LYDRIVLLDSFQAVAHSPEIVSVIEDVYSESVRVWDQQLIRVVYPEPQRVTARGIGAHQDGDPNLGYQAKTFCTAWVALIDIDRSVGGLAVSPRTHTQGILRSEGIAASSSKDITDSGYGLDPTELDWVTTDYEPGGTVIFACRTVHRGMPNHSDRIRLSGDFRYQPASASASWLTNTSGPDVRRVAQAIDETLASRALYVTSRPTQEMLGEVRRRMLEEENPSLERARELVQECREREQ
jgi:ectoine hydroxylase-related dioxygenase (phytanoyl-CoA dioxygenase family)